MQVKTFDKKPGIVTEIKVLLHNPQKHAPHLKTKKTHLRMMLFCLYGVLRPTQEYFTQVEISTKMQKSLNHFFDYNNAEI